MAMKRPLIAVFAILACLIFAWATGAGRPYPVSAGGVIDPTCTSSSPCIEYDNNGTGPGIRGISVAGNGLAGATKNHGTSAANGRAGLIGNDIGTGTFNSGVHGLSVGGTGVLGASTSGVGVQGTSASNKAVIGVSTSDAAVYGSSTGDRGVVGTGPLYGVQGFSNGIGVFGQTTYGIGVQGLSASNVGVNAVGGYDRGSDNLPALSIVANGTGGHFGDLIDGCQTGTANPCGSSSSVFTVDGIGQVFARVISAGSYILSSGDVEITSSTGHFLKLGRCVAGCTVATTASAGRAVTTYAPMVSQPTIEDFGETQLVNGEASVRLEPRFANVVDQSANYLVFITPEGDANTLYVTQKSMGGFTVRESHGGRSTLMFSYRIVAKPFGSHEARLPMIELPKLRSISPKQRAWHPGTVAPVH